MPFENRLRAMGAGRFADSPTQEMHKVTNWQDDPRWSPMPAPETFPGGRRPKAKLHWMQWLTYIVVILTCLAVLYGLLETWLFIDRLQTALEGISDTFRSTNLIGE